MSWGTWALADRGLLGVRPQTVRMEEARVLPAYGEGGEARQHGKVAIGLISRVAGQFLGWPSFFTMLRRHADGSRVRPLWRDMGIAIRRN